MAPLTSSRRSCAAIGCLLLAALAVQAARGQQPAPRFGGAYADLDARRQKLVDDWTGRFKKTTGQQVDSATLYDGAVSVSTKTTFDAVTHALMTTALTDASGASLGDALALVERVDAVNGEVPGTSGDRQFRMYAMLTPTARATLERSREFKRGADNTVFHRGYPLNYRGQGGVPSIQISIALDNRLADIDVDYRSSAFPAVMFNGHLSASNSDVRAGNNVDRHAARWTGLQNWWRGFFGIRLDRDPEAAGAGAVTLPRTPRVGKKDIDVVVQDFLQAWLVEGDIVAAMGYVSARAYACVAEVNEDQGAVDRGMAPFQIMMRLKAARETLGASTSLAGLVVGVRLSMPGIKVVNQPHHAQFVLYAVPDDLAAGLECENRMQPGGSPRPARAYGNYYGSTFHVRGRPDSRVAILWARDGDYWKIASWRTGVDDTAAAPPDVAAEPRPVRGKAEPGLVDSARGFLDTWLIRKDYDAALRYLSTKSYACYDLERSADQPASTSPDDAARRIRAAMERTGQAAGSARSLEALLEPAEPRHAAVRIIDHPYAKTFSLAALPTALGDAAECAARTQGFVIPDPLPPVYGDAFAQTLRFRTPGGEAPVLRLLWRKEEGAWKVRSYIVELP
jgi:hypothetical protein